MLNVRNVSYTYNNKQWALRNVSFELKEEGIVGLLGANGAGKSTLMNLICGILNTSHGELTVGGYNLNKQRRQSLSTIGFLPQKPPLYPELTVQEYLKHAAEFRKVPSKESKKAVHEAMKKCGIIHFKDRLIKNLSGGYQQRVGIAQAIIHNPKVIILDEPTNGLDPHRIMEMRELILSISKNTLILLSTHIMSEIEAICSRILVLDSGQLIVNKSITDFKKIIPKETIVIEIKDGLNQALQILQKSNYVVSKTNHYTLKVAAKHNNVNAILKLIMNDKIILDAIYRESATIEEVYKFISQ